MNYLNEVPDDKAFILGDTRIKSLTHLVKQLYTMSDESYNHYASSEHNYFADWILHVIKHKKLASKLRETKDRKEAIKVLEKEIEKLKKPKEKKTKTKSKKRKEKQEEAEEPLDSFVVSDPKAKPKEEKKEQETEPEKRTPVRTEKILEDIAKDEREIKEFLWKHFAWDMAKEFMYGLAIGILVGFVLSKIFMG